MRSRPRPRFQPPAAWPAWLRPADVPRGPAYAVLDPVTGAAVGQVTSGAPSPTLGHPVALAYVDTALAVPGTAVQVDVRGAAEAARVVELPFYRRPR